MPTELARQTLPPTTAIAFSPTQAPISDTLSAYIVALTSRGTQTISFRTGAGRILRDLSLHWPRMGHSEDAARELCIKITRAVFPLAKALFAQAVEISATFSPTEIKAPAYMEAMSTLIVFDTKNKVERHCFLSKEQPTPQEEMRLTPRGIVLLCRPLNYLYHTMSDDRKRLLYPGVGMYELAERQVNALHATLDYSLHTPPLDSIITKITDVEKGETSDFAAAPWPTNQILENAMLGIALNKTTSPDLQPPPSPQQRIGAEPQTTTTPPPSPAPEMHRSAERTAYPLPTTSSPSALLPANRETPSEPIAVAATFPPPRTRVEIERQAMHDVHNGKRPDVALYSAGNQYYRLAYDAYTLEHETSLAAETKDEVTLTTNDIKSPRLSASSIDEGRAPAPASAQNFTAPTQAIDGLSVAQEAPTQAALIGVPPTAAIARPITNETAPQPAQPPLGITEITSSSQSASLLQRQQSKSILSTMHEIGLITNPTNLQGPPPSGTPPQQTFSLYARNNPIYIAHHSYRNYGLQPHKYYDALGFPLHAFLPKPALFSGHTGNSPTLLRRMDGALMPPRSYAHTLLWSDVLLPLISRLSKNRNPSAGKRQKRVPPRLPAATAFSFPHRPQPRSFKQDVKTDDVPLTPQR